MTDPARVVCIGGSLAGIAAVERLVALLPSSSGLSFFIAIDDAATQDIAARLVRQTTMPVHAVAEATVARPDRVYVASAGLELTLSGGEVAALPPLDARGARCSIDRLFRCVAVEHGPSAVGVVLAGLGADGTIGLKLLKEAGAVTMVQVPSEAAPDEMPRMAVATGRVDFVLTLEAIATQLGDGLSHPALEPSSSVDEVLREILLLLRIRTGHDFTHYKRPTLFRCVARRMQVTRCTDLDAYLAVVRQEPSELAALLRDFMVSVTTFFRDPDAFELIKNFVVRQLFQPNTTEPIRVWVAGCATGEEAYSWGMVLLEKRAELDPARQIQIFASDIDEDALEEARRGRYPNTIALDVSRERLDRFFTRDGDFYVVNKDLRELVLFAAHNMLRDAPFSRLDVVSCRNVLIYLDRAMQDSVLRTAHFALRPERFLVLGGSENAYTTDGLFQPFDRKHSIFVRQPKVSLVLPGVGPKPRWAAAPFVAPHGPELRPELPARSPGELHQRMVERYAPPSLLVNEQLEVSHISQRASRYLRASPGEPTRDLFQMVLPELRVDLRAAVHSARRTPGIAVACTTRAQVDGESRSVRVGVQAEPAADPGNAHILVWFEEAEVRAEAASAHGPPIEPVLRQLEDELRHTREQLASTIEQYETLVEELHASNEELQAINEELRSAGEEIEATREETDSVNQELTTVNQELKLRIQETTTAKGDIANLMESSDVGVIFLDRDLRIHRFTQRTREVFNILDADVGRPLADLTSKINYPSLHADAREVLRSLTPIEREVSAGDRGNYLVRTRPYRSLDDRIAGVVVTFIDITALRRVEDALRSKEAMLELAERAANAGVWELDARGGMRMSSQCHRLYATVPSPLPLASTSWTANVVAEEREPLLAAVASALHNGVDPGLDIEFRVRHPEHGDRWLWMLGRKTDPASEIAGITLDITAARHARGALEEADRRKNEFIAMIAHELRNPLTPLVMALDILKLGGDDPHQAQVARGLMQRQVAQLRRLVDDLLDISRIQTGRLELRVEPRLPLREIIGQARDSVHSLVVELQHTLEIRLPDDTLVDGDPLRLGQIFVNLMTNAAKYTEPGGVITITAMVVGSNVKVSVVDSGVGIPAPILARIFELFVQAEPLTTRSRGGLGIGLSLVRQLVVLHGGTITAESEGEGRGSCFTVTLPLSRMEAA